MFSRSVRIPVSHKWFSDPDDTLVAVGAGDSGTVNMTSVEVHVVVEWVTTERQQRETHPGNKHSRC